MPPSNALTPAVGKLISQLRLLVDELALNEEVIAALLPNGAPHDFEAELWDYKLDLPTLADVANEEEKRQYRAKIGELIKDAVALHNAYGGYVIFGVADSGAARVRGCEGEFDCGDFNKRIESYAGASIQCMYARLPSSQAPSAPHVGVLLVPRRASNAAPIRFQKKGPDRGNGTRCFSEETYVRVRDECRPAAARSEDWRFLHSDRSPPDRRDRKTRTPVRTILPSRDPDLVKFVGRDRTLSLLREWLTDMRSPVRLITGIGGLGKTTLAFRFAEEVGDTGAGEIEWIIWLTAKQQTFSALRGQMVATGKVDFSDLTGLYLAILEALSHQLPVEEDEPTLDQLADRVIDALQSYTCLIIVDDIDSLNPDEQRETVASLSALALRTVGREIPSSRVLMTSRIDQGMPPTSVVKISGLEEDEFAEYVANLCSTFSIPPIGKKVVGTLWQATSGSPLFAASIIRLVKVGESLTAAIDTWRGQEGEDVRRFAFEREITRLDLMQAKLLYAVVLLGETSVVDLSDVLDTTAKVVRDKISELQAYHLISTGMKSSGDAVIIPPTDLIAVASILRGHLGTNADAVENACARARERSSVDSSAIGAGIRRIVVTWKLNRAQEALVAAKELRKKFPKSGDVSNILGQAFLRVQPPKYEEADSAFELARRLGCSRPELLLDSIQAKSNLQDWQGLYELTRSIQSNQTGPDAPLNAFLRACEELIATANLRGDYHRIAELAVEAVERITAKFAKIRIEKPYYDALNGRRLHHAHEYIRALDRMHPRAGDKLNVFDGVARLADADVILADLLSVGLNALDAWWRDVEARPFVDTTARTILLRQIKRLEQIERQLSVLGTERSVTLKAKTAQARMDLAHRGAQLSA